MLRLRFTLYSPIVRPTCRLQTELRSPVARYKHGSFQCQLCVTQNKSSNLVNIDSFLAFPEAFPDLLPGLCPSTSLGDSVSQTLSTASFFTFWIRPALSEPPSLFPLSLGICGLGLAVALTTGGRPPVPRRDISTRFNCNKFG